ncbi:hypothetical protein Esti_000071 [Eimeria stiedai]
MGKLGKPASAESPGLPLGVPSEVSPLSTGALDNRTPAQSPYAPQSPGSSRIAVAYRFMKQWVEDALVSNLNPTLHHVSRHHNCPGTAAEPPSPGMLSASPGANKRDTAASEVSRSNCSATPLSFTHPADTGGPLNPLPGCPSSGSCHYSNGLPWQAAAPYGRPRWPPQSPHEAGARGGSSTAHLRLASVEREPSGVSRLMPGADDVQGNHLTARGQGGVLPSSLTPGASDSKELGNVFLQSRGKASDGYVRGDSDRCHNHPLSAWGSSAKGSCEAGHKIGRSDACAAIARPPSDRNSLLQYGSFRVRWGEVKKDPSSVNKLHRNPYMCDSPTDCDAATGSGSKGGSNTQPSDPQAAAAFDVPSPGSGEAGDAASGTTKTQGLQNTGSLLWRMKDRLSSTFWSRTSGGSPAHISQACPSGPVKTLAGPDNSRTTDAQTSFPRRNDPQFHTHQTLVFKDREIERAYGEFLRKARVKRLIVVGVLTILLNTMYDMPEWIITITSPVLKTSEDSHSVSLLENQNDSITLPAAYGAEARAASSTAFLLVPLDVVEVLLQVVLAASGYLPFLKLHTERSAVLIMLSTSLLSSVRPVALLMLHGPQVGDLKAQKEVLIAPVQAIMTSTFLRSIVGSVLIDLVCLVRRQKLCHFHKLLSLLLLGLLIVCTVGGRNLSFPYSFFVFSWTVGLATGVVIASCHAGAYMSELMHRKAFHSVSIISAQLQRIQEENKSHRATGKNMLEQLVGLLKQMGASLSAMEPGNLDKPVRDTLLQVSALQAKCLGVLTSGRDMYAVNWLAPEVPPEMQVLYKKFIEPYVRQDSVMAGLQDVQSFAGIESSQWKHTRSHKEINSSSAVGGPLVATPSPREPAPKGETLGEVVPFQQVKVPSIEGMRLPQVEPACVPQSLGAVGAAGAPGGGIGSTLGLSLRVQKSNQGAETVFGAATQSPQPAGVAPPQLSRLLTQAALDTHGQHQLPSVSEERGEATPGGETREGGAEVSREDSKTDTFKSMQAAAPLWGGFSAESDLSIEEALRSPTVSSFVNSVGTEWTLDMFAIDQSTNGNCLVFVGLQLLLPHVRNGGLTCTLSALHAFLNSLQEQYLPNLYHNRFHGATVAHLSVMLARMVGLSRTFQLRLATPTDVVLTTAASTHTLARGNTLSCKQMQSREGKLMESSSSSITHSEAQAQCRKLLDDEVVMCLAALGHDVGHPGLNNAFLVSTNQSIALVYNDNAVLENYHAYLTFKLISANAAVDGGILKGFTAAAYRQLRKQVIDLILATDMAHHFPILSSFRARHASHTFSISANEEDKWMLAKLLIKTGDIGHSMLAWDQHFVWASRVNEEFYKQGDVEEQLGATISPLCDRRKAAEMPAAQCGFLEYIVLPLATEVRACLESQASPLVQRSAAASIEARNTAIYLMDGIIAHANYNLRCWKSMTTLASPRMQESGSIVESLQTRSKDARNNKSEQEGASDSGDRPD